VEAKKVLEELFISTLLVIIKYSIKIYWIKERRKAREIIKRLSTIADLSFHAIGIETLMFLYSEGWLQGRIQKFFEGGGLKNFCMDGIWHFFLKNPSKLKIYSQKGFWPPNPPPPEYAPGWMLFLIRWKLTFFELKLFLVLINFENFENNFFLPTYQFWNLPTLLPTICG